MLRPLFLATNLMMSTTWPAHAAYHWNPFGNMTAADATLMGIVLVGVVLLGWPLLLGALTYAVLERTHPLASAKVGRALLFACLVAWVSILIRAITAFWEVDFCSYMSNLMLFTSPIGGAVGGYFRHRRKLAA
jgi:hypothetical protein